MRVGLYWAMRITQREEVEGWLQVSTPAALFIIPTIPLFSSSPVCFVSPCNDLAVPPRFLPAAHWLSSLVARTRAFMNTSIRSGAHFRNEKQSGHWSGRQEMKVGADLRLDDGVIERVKGQSSKAVGLSTSITQTRSKARAAGSGARRS